MGDLILNEMLGRALPFIQNVADDSPTAAVLRIHAWDISATDNDLTDVTAGFVDDFEAITNVAEVTNTNYANISLDENDITITVDDTNDRTDVAFSDQTFSSIAAGDGWTDITVSYDADGSDTDTTTQVMFVFDFAVTPNGGDITVDFPAVCYRVTQA